MKKCVIVLNANATHLHLEQYMIKYSFDKESMER